MISYEAPRITEQLDLSGHLGSAVSVFDGSSDAEVKHGVEPVAGYEAPRITEAKQLDGRLILVSEYK